MKLVNKFTLWYISITLFVMLIGGTIAYYRVKKEIDDGEIERLKNLNNKTAEQIRLGVATELQTNGRPIEIAKLDSNVVSNTCEVKESSFYNPNINHKECRLTVNSYYTINDQSYRISSYNYVTKTSQILRGLISSFLLILLLLAVLIGISGRLVSNRILRPFHLALDKIHTFSLRDKKPMRLPETRTKEFNELNGFLNKMTDKVLEDYTALKEFSENASHELQTPLAIMRTKLDLLMETELNDDQAQLIGDIQAGIDRLSRINQSLILLNKLENHEFETSVNIPFCRATREAAATFSELMDMHALEFESHVEEKVHLPVHPALADILLNNLLSNAIRHNIPGGKVVLSLNRQGLIIKNTGEAPEVPTEQLFQRFKKGNQSSASIGVGLAIVKQICDLNSYRISYVYEENWHIMDIRFP